MAKKMQSIVVHAGFSWTPWSPHADDVSTGTGLGGSQLAASRIAYALALFSSGCRDVALFGDFNAASLRRQPTTPNNNLHFHPLSAYDEYCATHQIDLLVVSRYPQLLRSGANIGRAFLWCHDVVPMGDLPLLFPLKTLTVLGLSNWHCAQLRDHFADRKAVEIRKTSNGIQTELYKERGEPWERKVRNRFIYSSAIYRGLQTVLECWPLIRARLPDATLHVYADFASPLVVKQMPQLGALVLQKATSLREEGVVLRGCVGQRALRDAFYEAEIWFYPTEFEETYCITALEAQASGALCVYTPVAALEETVGDRGIRLPTRETCVKERYLPEITRIVCDCATNVKEDKLVSLRANARRWAMQQDWKNVAMQWVP